jgi:hypothetical protein
MNSTFLKGLLAVLIGAIASLISVQAASVWFYVITIVGVVITYFVQHAFLKPISIFGTIDVTDLLKGLIMAVGTALSAYATTLVTDEFSGMILLKLLVAAVVLYLGKNFASDSSGVFAKNTNAEYQQYKELSRRTRNISKFS